MRLLGSGGFGHVYEATQLALARRVVVKVLNADASADAEQVARFVNEARVTASLAHPNIVKLLDFDVEAGTPWIVYEFVPGEDLRVALSRGPFAVSAAIEAASQILAALEHAHKHEVFHRGIKPENVLREEMGRCQVTDFGIAKWHGQGAVRTAAGMILGTPAYLAPEQILGNPAGAGSDLYATGVVLHELLCGRRPFEAQAPLELLQKHLREQPPRLRDLRPDVPEALEALILALLEKHPDERPSSAARVRVQLELLAAPLDHPQTRTMQMKLPPTVAPAKSTRNISRSTMQAAPVKTAPLPVRSRRMPLALAGVAAALLLLATASRLGQAPAVPDAVASSAPPARAAPEPQPTPRHGRAAAPPRKAAPPVRWAPSALLSQLIPDALDEDTLEMRELRDAIGRNPDDPVPYVRLADCYSKLEKPNWTKAAKMAESVLKKPAGLTPAVRLRAELLLGKALAAKGEWSQSWQPFRNALQISKDNTAAMRGLGLSLFRDPARQAEAIPFLTRIVERDAKDLECRRALGFIFLYRQERAQSLPHLMAVADANPADMDCQRAVGLELKNTGRFRDALPYLQALTKAPNATADDLTNTGECYRYTGMRAEAVRCFEKAVGLLPGHRAASPLGQMLFEDGRLDDAERLCDEMLKRDPNSSEFRMIREQVFQKKNRPGEALRELDAILKRDPKNSAALFDVGHIRRMSSDVQGGIDAYEQILSFEPRNPDALGLLGDLYESQLRFDKAIEADRRTLAIRPEDDGRHESLARLLVRSGKPDEAVKELRSCVDAKPGAAWAARALGEMLLNQGKREEARHVLEKIAGPTPEGTRARHLLIDNFFDHGELAPEQTQLKAMLLESPRDDWAQAKMAESLEVQKRTTEALDAYKTYVAGTPQDQWALIRAASLAVARKELLLAEAAVKRAFELRPDDPSVTMVMGHLRLAQGRVEEAKQAYARAAKAPDWKFEASERLAQINESRGELAEAEQHFRDALGVDPKSIALRTELGTFYLSHGRDADAARVYRDGLGPGDREGYFCYRLAAVEEKLGHSDEAESILTLGARTATGPQVNLSLGDLLCRRGRPGPAVAAFRAAVRMQDDHPYARHALAVALRDSGDLAGAKATIETHLSRHPADVESLCLLGEVLQRTRNMPEAEREFQKAFKLEPRNPAVLVDLGGWLKESGRGREAEKMAVEATRCAPDADWAYQFLGTCRRELGDLPGAADAFRGAVKASPKNPGPRYLLAQVLKEQGRFAPALEECKTALALEPQNREGKREFDELARLARESAGATKTATGR
ncbi:MAG: tetratricopeptide repeat protein [Candidatus Wallbacteria bacterium]|nr:tetratricopeptide repeat protein [Candidatus Wallbacteria bacterium]